MTTPRSARPFLASLPFVLVATAVGAVAAQTPVPAPFGGVRSRAASEAAIVRDAAPVTPSGATAADAVAPRRAATEAATVAPPVASRAEPRITATWENAPIDRVLDAFAKFIRRPVVRTAGVTGTITARVVDEPWDLALRRILLDAGYAAEFRGDSVIVVDAKPRARGGSASAEPIPIDTIAVWLALHHPDIIRGNGSENRVTIVVDANDHYVTSSAETFESLKVRPRTLFDETRLSRDSIASVEVLKGAAAAELYGPGAERGVVTIRTKRGADSVSVAAPPPPPVTMNARTGGTFTAEADPIYIVDGVRMNPPVREARTMTRDGFGVDPALIASVDVLKLPEGKLSPNALSVVIVKLKP